MVGKKISGEPGENRLQEGLCAITTIIIIGLLLVVIYLLLTK